jgi:zinc/manganese transport system substrate-binding protein
MTARRKPTGAASGFTPRRAGPVLILGLFLACACAGCNSGGAPTDDTSWSVGDGPTSCPGAVIHVIAVENQYGSLVSRLGGRGVRFKSIITNPDADPHEFQTNFQVVQDYQTAQLVVENGLGYDDFSDKILETITHKPQVVNAGDVLGLKAGDNPHVWYDPDAVDRLCQAITAALKELNPAGSEYFDARARDYAGRLAPYHEAIARIRKRFAGTPVGATESIFVPMARATGLDLISPPGLMNAVAEDANPSVQDVAQFQQQIKDKKIKVLVYNNQTNGNLTSQLREMAEKAGIPVVGVSETLAPVDSTFENWQISQLKALEDALASSTGR